MKYSKKIDAPTKINLSNFDPNDDSGLTKEEGEAKALQLGKELDELEDLLFFAGQHSVLIVLQAMDTAGKDGFIRYLLANINGQGVKVAPFKVPTPEELARDFLWRCHAEVPGKGEMTLFNRSHYEDVLVVRVHEFVPEAIWSKRFEHINNFEKLLAEQSNTIILKFFLHISKDEQEERLIARENDVTKSWKLSVGDWKERELWDSYMNAYEDAIGKTSSEHAPWFVVPSNRKWHRNLAIMEALVEGLRPYKQGWLDRLESIGEKAKAELAAYRAAPKV